MKIKKFTDYKLFEDGEGGGVASATLGNTGGMGAIVAPIASSIPGDVAGSTRGSGDLPAYDMGDHFGTMPYKRKKKKKKQKNTSKESRYSGNNYDNMYVTKYTDWTNKHGLNESFKIGDNVTKIMGVNSNEIGTIINPSIENLKKSGNYYGQFDKSTELLVSWTSDKGDEHYYIEPIFALKDPNEKVKYKSDEDIENEYKFTNIKVEWSSSKESGWISYNNISGDEDDEDYNWEESDSFIIYDNGRIAFDKWYPDKSYHQLVRTIFDDMTEGKLKEKVREQYEHIFTGNDLDLM
jgi:hypothetical protein